MSACVVDGCGNQAVAKNLCDKHYRRVLRHGNTERLTAVPGSGTITSYGYREHQVNGKRKHEHVMVVEKAIGRPLREGEEVHHFDENKLNNAPKNLVLCPNHAYHMLLHVRAAALAACGHAHYRKCRFCKKFDDPKNMSTERRWAYHRDCVNTYDRKQYQRRKEKHA